MNYPIYRAQIDFNHYEANFREKYLGIAQGFYWYQHTADEHIIKYYDDEKERFFNAIILPETLEISFNDGITWRDLKEFMRIENDIAEEEI